MFYGTRYEEQVVGNRPSIKFHIVLNRNYDSAYVIVLQYHVVSLII
jgi:hypothetical protein